MRIVWTIDGQPFGHPSDSGLVTGTVRGDGLDHVVGLRVLQPAGTPGDSETVTFENCDSDPAKGQITSVDFGPCDDEGNRPVRLVCEVDFDGPVAVQWFLDGSPFGGAATPGPQVGSVPADGSEHVAELRIINPENAVGDSQTFVIPECESEKTVVAKIAAVDWVPENKLPAEPEEEDQPATASITAIEFVEDEKDT